ncbi:putative nucleotidyltransferase substrate binding domain-containing protein [Celerinatantimonas sp. MCCC 1A17872]|uniref:putative nucleotidyltransferase substrate binding domain-containing protein n=1 Tax=Celerinatantimonas sp. MCCC 1A17872 TaxID=3177514 RepID=UPI0038BEB202
MDTTLLPNICDFLASIDPFDKLPKKLLEAIAQQIQIQYLQHGDSLNFRSDDSEHYLYILRTGVIEQRLENGDLRARLGAEDQFGFTFFERQQDSELYHAKVLEDALLYLIPRSSLQTLLADYPQYQAYFDAHAIVRLNSALKVNWSNDKALFIRKVSELARHKITVVSPQMSIAEVAYQMSQVTISPLAVIQDKDQLLGVITDRDITRRVVAERMDYNTPIQDVMTPNPVTIDEDELIMHAAALMMQHNLRSLPVTRNGQVSGFLSTSHLVQHHRMQALFLIEKIKYAETVDELAKLSTEKQAVFEALIDGKVSAKATGHVMTLIMDAYTRRLIDMAIDRLGQSPCEFSWVVAGSHARSEVHLLSDQDSAIIVPKDSLNEPDKTYLHHLAQYVCEGLARCGYPLCSGHYMAANPTWCQPLSTWKEYYQRWVGNPEYEKLLHATVFLEVRTLYGDPALSTTLQNYLYELIQKNHQFLSSLTESAILNSPPLGIFKNFVLEKTGENTKELNVKKYALNLIVDLARIYGLSVGCRATGTEERFEAAFKAGAIKNDAYQNIIGAYHFLLQVRLDHQLQALKSARQPDNHIAPENFSSFERKHLKEAFKIIADTQSFAKFHFGRH